MSDELLEVVFGMEDEEVETFEELLALHPQILGAKEESLEVTAKFKTEEQGKISLTHGHHERNYVWHIKPDPLKSKGWKVSISRVLYAIAVINNKWMPNSVIIDLSPPDEQWDIKEITVKANDALDNWAVSEETLTKVTGQFFEVLNSLV